MSRSTKTQTPVVESTDTEIDAEVSTETTEASYEPSVENLVSDYQAGRVSKRDAKAWAHEQMMQAVTDGNFDDAQTFSKLFKAVDSAVRTSGRTSAVEIDAEEYVQAIVARVTALRQTASDLLMSVIVPGDVPDSVRDEVKALLVSYSTGEYVVETTGDILKSAFEPVQSLAKTRVIGYNNITSHLDAVVAGKATSPNGFPFTIEQGKSYRMSEIANLRTESYPDGVSVGHLASRFTHRKAERFPAGWVYADAQGLHGTDVVAGLRYVGTEA